MAVPSLSPGPAIGAGGYLGAIGRAILEMHFASLGAYILTVSMIFGGLLLSTDYWLIRLTAWIVGKSTHGFGRGIMQVSTAYAQKLGKRRSDLDDFAGDEAGEKLPIRMSGRPADEQDDEEQDEKRTKRTEGEETEASGRQEGPGIARGHQSAEDQGPPRRCSRNWTNRTWAQTVRLRTAVARFAVGRRDGPFRGAGEGGPPQGENPGKDLCRLRLQHPRGGNPDRAGHRPVRGGTGGRSAAEQDHRPGRRSGHRPARAQRAHRGPAAGQEHRGHRSAQQRAANRPPPRSDGRVRRQGPEDADSRLPGQGRGGHSAGGRSDHAAAPAHRRPHGHGQERLPELDHRLDADDPPARRSPHVDDRPEDGRAQPLQLPAAPDAPGGDRHAEGRGDLGLGGREDGGAIPPAGPRRACATSASTTSWAKRN